jgi:hypothetical protein
MVWRVTVEKKLEQVRRSGDRAEGEQPVDTLWVIHRDHCEVSVDKSESGAAVKAVARVASGT